MLPKNRKPTSPGEMLLKEFLEPMGVSQRKFSVHIGFTYARLNEIVKGHRKVTPESALILGEALQTGPEFWLNLQKNLDLWIARQNHVPVKPLYARLSQPVW